MCVCLVPPPPPRLNTSQELSKIKAFRLMRPLYSHRVYLILQLTSVYRFSLLTSSRQHRHQATGAAAGGAAGGAAGARGRSEVKVGEENLSGRAALNVVSTKQVRSQEFICYDLRPNCLPKKKCWALYVAKLDCGANAKADFNVNSRGQCVCFLVWETAPDRNRGQRFYFKFSGIDK